MRTEQPRREFLRTVLALPFGGLALAAGEHAPTSPERVGGLVVARYEDGNLVNGDEFLGDEFLGDWVYASSETKQQVGPPQPLAPDPHYTSRSDERLQPMMMLTRCRWRYRTGWCFVREEDAVTLLDPGTLNPRKAWGPVQMRVSTLGAGPMRSWTTFTFPKNLSLLDHSRMTVGPSLLEAT